MTFQLPKHIQEQLQAKRTVEHGYRIAFANLSDADLASSAEFWMHHCVHPKRFEPDAPVYDSTFWHVLVPEMLRRLKASAQP